MRFTKAGGGDPDEPAPALQLLDRRGAGVEHRLPQPTDELISDGLDRPAIGHLTLDTLRDQLVLGGDIVLEIAVLGVRAQRPRPDRAGSEAIPR